MVSSTQPSESTQIKKSFVFSNSLIASFTSYPPVAHGISLLSIIPACPVCRKKESFKIPGIQETDYWKSAFPCYNKCAFILLTERGFYTYDNVQF